MYRRIPEEDLKFAIALENLANQTVWNSELWDDCFHLAMQSNSELAGYVIDDIVHYSGRNPFARAPKPENFLRYVNEFRAVAFALRSGWTVAELKASGRLD